MVVMSTSYSQKIAQVSFNLLDLSKGSNLRFWLVKPKLRLQDPISQHVTFVYICGVRSLRNFIGPFGTSEAFEMDVFLVTRVLEWFV